MYFNSTAQPKLASGSSLSCTKPLSLTKAPANLSNHVRSETDEKFSTTVAHSRIHTVFTFTPLPRVIRLKSCLTFALSPP